LRTFSDRPGRRRTLKVESEQKDELKTTLLPAARDPL